MREPYVVAMDQSPFDLGASAEERRARAQALNRDLVTDEAGIIVAFGGEDDVDALLNDPRFGAVAMPILEMSGVTDGPLYDLWSLLMFAKDGDEHKRLRSAVARDFTPRAVERYRADIERYARHLADPIERAGTAEVWSDFALPLSARAACRIVGIDEGDADRVAIWALDIVNAFFFMSAERRTRAEAAAVEFVVYVDELIAAKQRQPGDDLTSKLIAADAAHDLARDEVRALIANLVFGGLEATAKAITTGVLQLVSHDTWKDLVADPALVPHAVGELLRFTPPTGVARFAREDVVCRDVQLREGQMAMLDIDAACHDARRYPNPDSLDLTRDVGRQLAFGAGAHFCLGANLAKITYETALTTLTTRFPALQLAVAPDDAGWDFETFQGVVSLPFRVDG